jgi:pimeloyl-ACP methyl ester carboxylesterase
MLNQARTRRVAGAGVSLEVAELGDATRPSVLLIHGYPDTRAVWKDVAARLAERFHVVAYDVRGAGASDAPRDPSAYRLADLSADVTAVLAAVAPDRRVHLVGHDWGSVQGWAFAADPGIAPKLASFTSISGPPLDHVGAWFASGLSRPDPARWVAMAEQACRSWYVGALSLPGFAEVAWPLAWGPLWPALMTWGENVPGGAAHPAATVATDGVRGAGLYRENVWARLSRPSPAPARVPVQLIVPTRDRYLSSAIYEGIDAVAPSLVRRDVDAGHWLPRTHPGPLADWITAFIEDVESAGSLDLGQAS